MEPYNEPLISWVAPLAEKFQYSSFRAPFYVGSTPAPPSVRSAEWKRANSTRIEYAFVRNPSLLIVGGEGSGKTTLVQWLTHELTYRQETMLQRIVDRRVPFPIFVKDLPMEDLLKQEPTWKALLQAASQTVNESLIGDLRFSPQPLSVNVVETLIKSGQAAVLVDDLDFYDGESLDWLLAALQDLHKCNVLKRSHYVPILFLATVSPGFFQELSKDHFPNALTAFLRP